MSSGVTEHPYREFERAGWARAAGAYAGSFASATGLFAPALLAAVKIVRGSKVLDVACGPGPVSARAAALGAEVTGVDFSPAMVAEAKRTHPALRFLEADAEALPLEDAQFDAVVINFGLHHFPYPVRALSEARRVLRAGGRIGFTTWAAPAEHVIHRIVVDAVREAGDPAAALPMPPGGVINETETCLRLLREAGFPAGTLGAEPRREFLIVGSARELLAMLEAGTVRMASTLRSQSDDKRAAILAAIERGVAEFRTDGGLRIPFAAILATATK